MFKSLQFNQKTLRFPLIVGFIFLILFSALFVYSQYTIANRSKTLLEQESISISGEFNEILRHFYGVLYSAQSLFESSDSVSRPEWKTFVTSLKLDQRYPGVAAVSFAKHITDSQKVKFIQDTRNDKSRTGQDLSKYNIFPDTQNSDYFPIYYLEPSEGRESSFGFNVISETTRAETVKKAIDLGEIVATSPVKSITSGAISVNLYLPIYKNNTPLNTVEQKRAAVDGVVIVGINPATVLKDVASKNTNQRNINYDIYDSENTSTDGLIYTRRTNDIKDPIISSFEVNVATRKWVVQLTAPSDFGLETRERYSSISIIVISVIITLLAMLLVYSLGDSRERALRIAKRITESLEKSDAQLKAFVTYAPIIIWSTNKDGVYSLFEGQGVDKLGIKAGELVGKSIYDIYKNNEEDLNIKLVKTALAGIPGHEIIEEGDKFLEKWSSPIKNKEGQITGVTGITIDVTDQVKTRKELESVNEMMLGRELKMAELKQKLDEMNKKASSI